MLAGNGQWLAVFLLVLVTVTYTYDQLNRLTQKTYPDTTTVNYTYDNDSRLTQVVDPTGTYSFTFDNMGRLTGTTTSYSFLTSRNFTTAYSYDAASNRTGFTDPESGSSTYAYDTLNRLQTLTPPTAISSGNFGFGYDALSRRTSLTRPNSVNTSYSYDNLSRLLSVTHAKSGTTLDGASYTVDNAGNRTAKSDLYAGVTSNYTYDSIYELTQAKQGTSATESYSFDPVGNRLSSLGVSSYTNNSSNELTSTSNATYTYDNNGNTLTKVVGSNTTQYFWDYENRMSSVTLPGSGGTVSFKYDPFGRRIYKSSSSATSVFAYDGDNLVEETNSSGTSVARYSQGLNIDEPLAMLRSSTTSYYQADGLGSITSLSNSAGSIANTYTYDSFGNLTASTGSLVNSFRYTGREFDSETNLYYYRARYFDVFAGRFVSEDPASFLSGGVNFYGYVENSPIGFKDPNGLQAKPAAPCCDEKKIKDGLKQLQQGFTGAAASKSAVFQKYQNCLQKLANDPDVKCGPPPKKTPTACGYHNDFSPGTIFITPNGSRGLGGCTGVKSTVAHEMVHSCYQNDMTGPKLSDMDQEKEAFGLECQLWGINCACARNPKLCGY